LRAKKRAKSHHENKADCIGSNNHKNDPKTKSREKDPPISDLFPSPYHPAYRHYSRMELKLYKNREQLQLLVPRWLLIIADILFFWTVLPLDPQGFDPAASGASTSPTGILRSLWTRW